MATCTGPDVRYDDLKLPYGMLDGRLVRVSEVPNGEKCGCRCPKCEAPLIAKNSDTNKRRHHFSHKGDYSCVGSYETTAHLAAKQIIEDHGWVVIPAIIAEYEGWIEEWQPAARITLDTATKETALSSLPGQRRIIPDIHVTYHGGEAIFEIYVTHHCPPDKLAALHQRGMQAIEIDVSRWQGADLLGEAFQNAVLQNAPRKWISNPRDAEATAWLGEIVERKKPLLELFSLLAKAQVEARKAGTKVEGMLALAQHNAIMAGYEATKLWSEARIDVIKAEAKAKAEAKDRARAYLESLRLFEEERNQAIKAQAEFDARVKQIREEHKRRSADVVSWIKRILYLADISEPLSLAEYGKTPVYDQRTVAHICRAGGEDFDIFRDHLRVIAAVLMGFSDNPGGVNLCGLPISDAIATVHAAAREKRAEAMRVYERETAEILEQEQLERTKKEAAQKAEAEALAKEQERLAAIEVERLWREEQAAVLAAKIKAEREAREAAEKERLAEEARVEAIRVRAVNARKQAEMRAKNIAYVAQSICDRVGVRFSWEDYQYVEIPGFGSPHDACWNDQPDLYNRLLPAIHEALRFLNGENVPTPTSFYGLPINDEQASSAIANVLRARKEREDRLNDAGLAAEQKERTAITGIQHLQDRLISHAIAHLGSAEIARLWVRQRNPKLRNLRPVELCINQAGLNECLAVFPPQRKTVRRQRV